MFYTSWYTDPGLYPHEYSQGCVEAQLVYMCILDEKKEQYQGRSSAFYCALRYGLSGRLSPREHFKLMVLDSSVAVLCLRVCSQLLLREFPGIERWQRVFWFCDLRISSFLLADELVQLQVVTSAFVVGPFADECEGGEMRISTSKSEAHFMLEMSCCSK